MVHAWPWDDLLGACHVTSLSCRLGPSKCWPGLLSTSDTLVVAIALIAALLTAALLLEKSTVSVTDPRFGRRGTPHCSECEWPCFHHAFGVTSVPRTIGAERAEKNRDQDWSRLLVAGWAGHVPGLANP